MPHVRSSTTDHHIGSLFFCIEEHTSKSATVQDEAAVMSRDKLKAVVVVFFRVMYAVLSSANMKQLFTTDFGKSLIKIKNRRLVQVQ